MSILAEIINSAEIVDVEYINKKVPEIKHRLESFKAELITIVDNVYVKYSHRPKKNDLLLNRMLQAENNLNVLKEKAEYLSNKDLVRTNAEVSKNIDELQGIDRKLKVLQNIQNVLRLIYDFDSQLSGGNYISCVEILKNLEETIKSIPSDEYPDTAVELKQTFSEKIIRFHVILKNIFTDNIEIIKSGENKITLKVKKSNEDMKNTILALYSDTEQISHLHSLTKNLWEEILVPLVNSDVTIVVKESESYMELNLVVIRLDTKSHYKKVFGDLQKVLEFLLQHFNYTISGDLTTIHYIANDIRDNLSELIIKSCLRDTIPSTAEGLQNYKVVIEATKELEKVLLESKIFNEDTASILEYASKVDVWFINKKCDDCLQKATDIMEKDLHDMIQVGVPFDKQYPLGQHLQDFPQCSISKNVLELIQLCENILQEAIHASPECSGRLFTTVANIVARYPGFVAEFHDYYLSLPQHIALYYNNCQYISNTLRKWSMNYCPKLVKHLVICDFTNEATQLPITAVEIFSTYVEGQIKLIDEIMSGAELDGLSISKLDSKTEKCVRQALRQLEILRTVWHKVLSYDMYNKHIGTIVDALCKSFINSIVKFEDIPASVAGQFVSIINLIFARASELFTNPKEVRLFVPLWYKLEELHSILKGSLVDIEDRWADGKGPLALQFEASEVKKLIKSLFQNTDKRAALLAKITDVRIKS